MKIKLCGKILGVVPCIIAGLGRGIFVENLSDDIHQCFKNVAVPWVRFRLKGLYKTKHRLHQEKFYSCTEPKKHFLLLPSIYSHRYSHGYLLFVVIFYHSWNGEILLTKFLLQCTAVFFAISLNVCMRQFK